MHPSRNVYLHEAMQQAGVTFRDIAVATGANVKTVQRWVYEGRLPRPQRAEKVAALFGVPVGHLFARLHAPLSHVDLVDFYPTVHAVSWMLWRDLAKTTRHCARIACDSPPMLPDDIGPILADRARARELSVQIVVGRNSPVVLEGPGVVARRCDNADPMSIYQFGDQMLVWLNRGAPGAAELGPVLHLCNRTSDGVFDAYARMLSRLWDAAAPVSGEPWSDWFATKELY